MAQIDSGLGWNCDEAYFVKEISQKLSTHNVDFYKLNVGSAIACDIKDADGYICPFIVSTIPEYVTYTNNTTVRGSVAIDGVTWYYSSHDNGTTSKDLNATIPYIEAEQSLYTVDTIRQILTAANVQVTTNKIPTINYVHNYVTGVLKGMPQTVIAEYNNKNVTIHGI